MFLPDQVKQSLDTASFTGYRTENGSFEHFIP